jgi:diphosphomevalonate decarboxylase
LASVPDDLARAEEAISARDVQALGEVTERSALTMHAATLASRPGIWFLSPATLLVMERVVKLREGGTPAFFTMDAGPHVKVLTLGPHVDDVVAAVRDTAGVTDVIVSAVGSGVELV